LKAVIKEIRAVTAPIIKFIFTLRGVFFEALFRLKKWMYNLSIIKVPKPEAKIAVSNSGVSKENHPKTEKVTLTYTQ
jgi:hypothetical protein